MPESRADPAIKLFGRTIPLPPPPGETEEAPDGSGSDGGGDEEKDLQNKEASPESMERDHDCPEPEETIQMLRSSKTVVEIPKPSSSSDQENPQAKDSEAEEPPSETNNSQEKTLKKPDKILPCPRCKSLDTKFCYYNNYNVNQPRHFCKNCQRYWTAGGTMRNVPVGAGRRKNKNSTSHYRHITMSDAGLQAVRPDAPQPIHHPPSKPNGTVLSFGSDMPLCESMASVLNLAEKPMKNSHRNGFCQMEEKLVPFSCVVENGDEHLNRSSVTTSNSNEEGTRANLQESPQVIPAPIPYLNGSPWPYPWSPTPAFCTSSFSIPFYPATAYWGCTVPGPWTVPWLSPLASSSPTSDSSVSGSNTPTLGKHSREGDVLINSNSEKGDGLKENKQERCLWVPKTLRIDNPDEAAKSSIWAMMGVKNVGTDAINRGELFKAFQRNTETNKNHRSEASEVLHANPAALSRSVNFQEIS